MSEVKHKSQRSVARLIGQSIDPGTGAVTGAPIECRIAFPFHHEKRTKSAGGDPLDKPRYDAVVLVPKLNKDAAQCANYAGLAAHCMEAATKAWQSFPQGGKWPIQDGDVPHTPKPKPGVVPLTAEQIREKNKWREGHWVIEVANNLDLGPKVCLMQNGQAVEIPAKVVMGQQLYKSGDYGYVSISAYSFQNKTFGVNFSYEGVLYTREGELIGSSGAKSAAQMFGGVAPVAAAGGPGPMPPQAPQAQPMPTAPVAPQAPAAPMPPAAPVPGAAGLPPFPGGGQQ